MTRTGFLGDLLAQLVERRFVPFRSDGNKALSAQCRDLLSSGGEVSGMRLAREILARYRTLDEAGRTAFFHMLVDAFDIDPDEVAEAAGAYAVDRDAAALRRVVRAAEPARQELLRRLNQAPGATRDLVHMRRDLLQLVPAEPSLARADLDFAHLFASWFNRGFLVLRQITWESPAKLLEKIIEYEAVHAIGDWEALRARIDPPDRRCFAFFHPAMPDEPLIFVEVALVRRPSGSVEALLDPGRSVLDPAEADTATFYSISNCQEGLRGISFGNSLIKQVVELLRQEFPHLRGFVTLSPIPGLARWMRARADAGEPVAAELLATGDAGRDFDDAQALSLRRLAARYLLEAKRPDGRPLDPVARFHLGNGAQLLDIHARADRSPRGLQQAFGAMVNYDYDIAAVEQNHEDYVERGTISAMRAVRALARAGAARPAAETPRKETTPNDEPAS